MKNRSPNFFYFAAVCVIGFTGCLISVSKANKDVANQRPHQVRAEVINSTSLRLKWRRPKAEIVCPTKRYMIRLKETARSITSSTKVRARVWKFNSSHTSAIVHELKPDSEYMIRIVAENCASKWKSSSWIIAKTPKDQKMRTEKDIGASNSVVGTIGSKTDRPPGQPMNVRTEAVEHSVLVSWEAPPSDTGSVRGYMIGYGEGVPDVNWQYVGGRQRNVTINNLKKATQYVISVSAYNDFGRSSPVYSLVYTKGNSGKIDANVSRLSSPSDIGVRQLTPSSLRLQWFDSSLGARQELRDGRYYNIHYRATPDGKTTSILVKDLSVIIGDLMPSTRYEFRIRTMREGLVSDFSDAVFVRTIDDDDDDEEEEEVETLAVPEEEEPDEQGAGLRRPASHPNNRSRSKSYESPEVDVMANINNDTRPSSDALEMEENSSEGRNQRSPEVRKRRIQPRQDSLYAVRFKSVVYHKVTAFVTWPPLPQQTTSICASGVEMNESASVIGYRLRYQRLPASSGGSDPEVFATKEVRDNFVLLEDLTPESRYRYQIQYLAGGNSTTNAGWSGEGIIDTRYTGAEGFASP